MILYVNGDSHTAGAEAATSYAFAEDDPALYYLGRIPHPENLAVSWGRLLSLTIKAGFHCGAESGSSNTRILRTTREWLSQQRGYDDVLLIIQWSTWEREEWPHSGTYLQVGASGTDHVPDSLIEQYKNFVISVDWKEKTQQAHDEIWQFHCELKNQGIKHIFFNGNNDFSKISERREWGINYIEPYNPEFTYSSQIQAQGIQTVAPDSWHFGKDGHSFWHRFMLQYCIDNKFI